MSAIPALKQLSVVGNSDLTLTLPKTSNKVYVESEGGQLLDDQSYPDRFWKTQDI